MEWDWEGFRHAAAAFPKPSGIDFSYGTAGFRLDASLLASTVFRAGVLAALRSLSMKSATGLVITASHNPASDNGVKLVDPGGGMLAMRWEPHANAMANASDEHALTEVVRKIIKEESIAFGDESCGKVLLARDTRPSGQILLAAASQGVAAVAGVAPVDMGILTTPQLHWMVCALNKDQPATEVNYYSHLSQAFRTLEQLRPDKSVRRSSLASESIIIDGANGVGALKLLQLQELLENLQFEVRNCGRAGEGGLNDGVGADFVQKEKAFPRNFDKSDALKKCASIDGDADRLVYFYFISSTISSPSTFNLLDGDKISALFARFIRNQLQSLVEDVEEKPIITTTLVAGYGDVRVGVVQTAYANGASTKYLQQELGLEVSLTSTGVKYLHEKASEYDIGIYFEANGHGTILFREEFLAFLRTKHMWGKPSIHRLLAVSEMINQAVGDALSGILMVEIVLMYLGWSIQDWNDIYADLPSKQLKVKVANRAAIRTTASETKVVYPSELQKAIDTEVGKYDGGRSFVRPSGTEDIVRIYAEATTQSTADALAQAVAFHVYRLAGGVGPQPS
ncbi:hypothetical protein O6H91_22G026900 [Diphasiastrum complanatum]|uniref:Uncharacterized protein n=1 Tax=Diphasiastrum complanatum TaxID=34168 RepID=A0ACC2ADW6_DIPCM|nr:hypothetical protein O6H91_22G026900 [Diphasiastrum complanatum]